MGGLAVLHDAAASLLDTAEAVEAARIALGGVFLWAGSIKVGRPGAAALALVHFGVVHRPRIIYGRAVGIGELALSTWLVADSRVGTAALVASVILLVFAAGIARALVRGERFACACFGAEGSLLGIPTLIRTLALAGLALVIAVSSVEEPRSSLSGDAEGAVVAIVVSLAAIALLVRAVTASWRHNIGGILRSPGGSVL